MADTYALLLAVALLLGNGFFVGAEFALVAARRTQVEAFAERGSKRAGSTLRAMRRVSLMMAGAQLGITLCTLGLGAVGEPAVAHLLEPAFHAVGVPDTALHPAAFVVATLVVVSLHVVVGEMVPKNLALAGPERTAMLLGPPLAGLVKAARPVISGLNAIANVVLRIVRVEPREEVSASATDADVASMVDEARREGLMDAEEHSRVSRSLRFGHTSAREVMLDRPSVVDVPEGTTARQIESLAARTGHSRFPVRSRDGDWLYYAHLKDIFEVPADDQDDPLALTSLRRLPSVAAGTPLLDVLETMRNGSTNVVAVHESEGHVEGLVLLDDVLLSLLPGHAA